MGQAGTADNELFILVINSGGRERQLLFSLCAVRDMCLAITVTTLSHIRALGRPQVYLSHQCLYELEVNLIVSSSFL